jgi:hypothetical protein
MKAMDGNNEAGESYIADSGDMNRAIWPAKPFILSILLAVCGFLYWALLGQHIRTFGTQAEQYQYAIGTFIVFGGLAVAFSLERDRWLWSVVFGLAWGLVLAGVAYWVGGYSQRGFEWNFAFGAGIFALIIATPIFQTLRDNPSENQRALSYDRLHFYSWSDTVIGFSALAFTGLSWLLIWLIALLFELIGLSFVMDLLDSAFFGWAFSGAAFGAALGILRENDRILGLLQNVVLIVLSILTPFLAFALGLFLVSLIFTGLDGLWSSTKSATPILISCAVGAVILANAVIRNNEGEASQSIILRIAAIILGVAVLPLAIIAVISTGLRIGQYGLTPERLWGLLVVAIGVAYGLAYWVSVIRAGMVRNVFGWAGFVRSANTKLAIGLCLVALFLSLPLLDFGAISARDQLSRLDLGKVSEAEFDYYALANDFGPTGRAMAKQMAAGDGERASLAKKALATNNRWEYRKEAKVSRKVNLTIAQGGDPLPDDLREKVRLSDECDTLSCTAIWADDDYVIVLGKTCRGCRVGQSAYLLIDGEWGEDSDYSYGYRDGDRLKDLAADAKVEIRTIERRQIYVDGKPLGRYFK